MAGEAACAGKELSCLAKRAAKALVSIGGPREVLAMDIWLKGIPPEKPGKEVVEVDNERPTYAIPRRDEESDRRLRQNVQECRHELQRRLDAERKTEEKKPKKNEVERQ
jgi:hypothetical protein